MERAQLAAEAALAAAQLQSDAAVLQATLRGYDRTRVTYTAVCSGTLDAIIRHNANPPAAVELLSGMKAEQSPPLQLGWLRSINLPQRSRYALVTMGACRPCSQKHARHDRATRARQPHS